MLKTTTKTVHYVDYNDFDNKVKEIYGHDFEIIADAECSNDSNLSSGRMVKRELDEYEAGRLAKFILTGKEGWIWQAILQDMVNSNHAPEGEYIINVSW